VAKFAKNRPKMGKVFSTCYLRNQNSTNAKIGTNVTHGVRMMPELFVL